MKLMKNSSGTITNRTWDILACSRVPQPTVPLHALLHTCTLEICFLYCSLWYVMCIVKKISQSKIKFLCDIILAEL